MSTSAVRDVLSQFNTCLQNQTKHAEEGIYVLMENEANVLVWSVLFGKFPPDSALGIDLQRYRDAGKPDYIKLEVEFPSTYPLSPPFIRVIFPRFQFHTGHVTVGGSLCIESLVNTGTPTGWQPSTSMWAIFVQCKQLIVDGGGRIDFSRWNHEYSKQEAQAAFTRVAGQHGWITRAAVASAGLYVPNFPATCNPWWDQNQVSTLSAIGLPGLDPQDNGLGSMRYKEAMAIAKIFLTRWGYHSPNITIVSITRIQNLRVFDKYYVKLQELSYIAQPNERWMFHGLKSPDVAKAIVEHGFDARVSERGFLGAGIYCAEHVELANSYTVPDSQGIRYCVFGRFLLGEIQAVDVDRSMPTYRRGQTYSKYHHGEQRVITRNYDSQSSFMHSTNRPFAVLFSNEQAYPDYVIMYKT